MIGARTALSASWAAGVIQRAVGKARTAGLRPVVFGMKNAEGVFLSLPARNERGESWREGMKNGLLLSSFLGRRGRRQALLRPRQTTCRTGLGPAVASPVPRYWGRAATLKVQSCCRS